MTTSAPLTSNLVVPVHQADHRIGCLVNPRVTLVEYGDYECPSCVATHPQVDQLLQQFGNDEGGLLFVFRHFPLTTVHPTAGVAAQAAEAAAAQGKFWEMHRLLYATPGGEQQDHLDRLALKAGLEMYRFSGDLTSGVHAAIIAEHVEGARLAGVRKTPTFFLNGQRLDASHDEALPQVEAMLRETS